MTIRQAEQAEQMEQTEQTESLEGFQLAPQQKHLWQLQRSAQQRASSGQSGSPYLSQCVIRIEGALDKEQLKTALSQVIEQLEILRTTFHHFPGMPFPVQVIGQAQSISMTEYDLRDLDTAAQESRLDALFQELLEAPLDFAKSPLQTALVILAPDQHRLLLRLPALCADMTTLNLLLDTISQAYAAGFEPDFEPIQYADLAEWLNENLDDPETEPDRAYWHQPDHSASLRLKLPLEENQENRADGQALARRAHTLIIEPAVMAEIEGLAHREDVSPADLLLACWQTLLWRLTGQSDLTVGAADNGRSNEELSDAIGLLTRYLPLQCHLTADSQLRDLLGQIKAWRREAEGLQEYFSWEQLSSEADGHQEPYWPFCFDAIDAPASYTGADLTFSMQRRYSCPDWAHVQLIGEPQGGSLALTFYYDAARYQHSTIQRLADQFQTLLTGLVNDPAAALDTLTLVSAAERQKLLVEWNGTAVAYPQDMTLPQWFEAQVARTPDAVAVVYEDQQLTYQDLNRRANRLAHHLQGLGVGPDVMVGICLTRSVEMVIGLLGILKAGGAYVPLDPAYPQDRLAFMIEDAGVPVILTQQNLVTRLPDQGTRIICLDADQSLFAQAPDTNPARSLAGHHLAYVIYTSGSTGKPKGVMIEHQGLVNYLQWCTDAYQVTQGNGTLVHSPLGFDLTVTSLFAPLVVGRRVVLLPEVEIDEGLKASMVQEEGLSLLKITPAHLTLLSQLLSAEQAVGRTRAFIIGGEALFGEHLSFWQTHAPETRLINEYGPSETVVGCCVYEAPPDRPLSGSVPIGRPIANTQLYVLNQHRQPVPIGVPGELYIGGIQVARGYHNRPELTAEKFVTNPFGEGRLYRTGDLVRYLSDGNLEFLDRIDNQIKLHGFRIELGEIETVLAGHPTVREASVIVREDQPGQKQLIAYTVPHDGNGVTPDSRSDLTQFLQQTLPGYMVPAVIISLDALPLTPNGKVDRRALPVPDRGGAAEAYVAPSTPVEETLTSIWADILGLDRVGVHDNFFALGGDSILSIQVVAKANQQGLYLTVQQIFQHQTIAELALVTGESIPIQAEQGPVSGPVPLTPIQRRFLAQEQAAPHHFNQSVLLETPPDLDPALLEQALQALWNHHDGLRLRFIRDAEGWTQENSMPDDAPLLTVTDLAALSSEAQQEAMATATTDCQASFDLAAGPLLRAVQFQFGADQPGRLLLVIHHLAVDGVSWRILIEDLQTSYQQLAQNQALALLPKTTSFKQWAERLADYAQSEVIVPKADHWLAQPWSETASLPVDRTPSPESNTVATAETIEITLDQAQTQRLLQEVPAVYNTQINDVLLTALTQTFAGWTGRQTLLVDLEGHGREALFDDVDLSRTMGWFTSIYPVILTLASGGQDDPGEALKGIKEHLRRIPNRGIDYGLLRYLNRTVGPQLQALPQAEVIFNYQGQFDHLTSSNDNAAMFSLAQEKSVPNHSPLTKRPYLLEVDGLVVAGQLQLHWTFSQTAHDRSTIERLAEDYISRLEAIIRHCQSPEAGGFTPSDFPEANVSQIDLDRLLEKIS